MRKILLIMSQHLKYNPDLEQKLVSLMSQQLENGCISYDGGILASETGCILTAMNVRMLLNTGMGS